VVSPLTCFTKVECGALDGSDMALSYLKVIEIIENIKAKGMAKGNNSFDDRAYLKVKNNLHSVSWVPRINKLA